MIDSSTLRGNDEPAVLAAFATVITIRAGIVTLAVLVGPLARGSREGRVISRAGWNARGQVTSLNASCNVGW